MFIMCMYTLILNVNLQISQIIKLIVNLTKDIWYQYASRTLCIQHLYAKTEHYRNKNMHMHATNMLSITHTFCDNIIMWIKQWSFVLSDSQFRCPIAHGIDINLGSSTWKSCHLPQYL